MRYIKLLPALAVTFMLSSPASAFDILDCPQKQNLCNTRCELSNIGEETEQSSCKAKCLGERTRCSAQQGVEKAKELSNQAVDASKGALDKAKAFIDGLTE